MIWAAPIERIIIFVVCALFAALALAGCAQFDVYVEKNIYVENSEEVDVNYTTRSEIDGELRQDLKDLIDATIPLR